MNPSQRAIKGKLQLFSILISWKLEIQYSRRLFYRDLQIHPAIAIVARSLVSSDSPAFTLVDELVLRTSDITAEALQAQISSVSKDLRCLFRRGRASPGDINFLGQTLLHRASNVHGHLWPDRMSEIWVRFMKELVLMGYKILTLPDIYQCFSWHLDGFDYGALSSALFQKSEPALRRILMASSSIMIERCHNDQTPLHVAAYWPRGLQLLFELAGDACRQIIDLEDASQLTAIHSAVLLHQVDSVKLLLEQGASIDLENSATFFGHPYTLDADYQSQEIIDLLCDELAVRRREMLRFARKTLTVQELFALGTTKQTMLQTNAFEVLQALQARNIDIPSIFQRVRPGSIYHSPVMNGQLTEGLYRSGFEGFNFAFNGWIPLATMRIFGDYFEENPDDLLNSIAWFEAHGVDIKHAIPTFSCSSNETIPSSSASPTTLLRLATAFGKMSKLPCYIDSSHPAVYHVKNKSLLTRILSDTSRDGCKCYCSSRGCSPASAFAKAWPGNGSYVSEYWILNHLWNVFSTILHTSRQQNPQPLLDFVRATTFDFLGMSHTCCKYKYDTRRKARNITNVYDEIWIMDPKEVAEIQEEDRYLADNLEELMEELAIRLINPSFDPGDFGSYWRTRVEEVEGTKEKLTCEDIRAIREIGISLE
ncbi:hypothetical protein CTAM01_16915 [Colletotrichum tamarilloi]|uniref:Ankyrin n=1 Tax=Colletotrichum tamarilloi TaxID=1209934 RepID=A0ABQ9QH69_9PEZI|nr:uncharacterized protein CTAM01_16915 [Colletotrichum tamarilloi]KAK1468233.1 hypothetical protein CTAM01_16915 [Colletotrichum tamarilloi]